MPNLKGRRHYSPAASGPGDGRTRPRPTPELLRLYTNMRDLGEGISFEDLLQLREDPTAQNAHLLPPTPDATSMSRSTSYASSYSIGQAIENLEITEPHPQEDIKRKLGRHGPLPMFAKARTAFIRKLKACPTCHSRKVKCTHHDLSLFEREYNASKGTQTSLPDQTNLHSPINSWGRVQESTTLATDLLGVGTAPTSIPEASRTIVDFDHLLSAASPPSLVQQSRPPAAVERIGTGNAYFLEHHHGTNANGDRESMPIPIGRELAPVASGWECRGTDTSDGAAACLQRFSTIAELDMHFRMFHTPFRELNPPYLYNCRICGFLNDIPSGCFQCEATEEALERWYFGQVQQQSSSATAPVQQLLQFNGSSPGSVTQHLGQGSYGLDTFNVSSHGFSGSGFGWSTTRNFGLYSLSGRRREPDPVSSVARAKIKSPLPKGLVRLWPAICFLHQQYLHFYSAHLGGRLVESLIISRVIPHLKQFMCHFVIAVILLRVSFPISTFRFPASDVDLVAFGSIFFTIWLAARFWSCRQERQAHRMRLPSRGPESRPRFSLGMKHGDSAVDARHRIEGRTAGTPDCKEVME